VPGQALPCTLGCSHLASLLVHGPQTLANTKTSSRGKISPALLSPSQSLFSFQGPCMLDSWTYGYRQGREPAGKVAS
jgi:hypothetical protein